MAITFETKPDTVTWTTCQTHTALQGTFLTFCQPLTRVTLELLPVYVPNDEEKKDAKLYAKNVQKLLSKHLDIPISSKSASDWISECQAEDGVHLHRKRRIVNSL